MPDSHTPHVHYASGTGHSPKDFLPLIAMVALVLALTLASMHAFSLDPMLAFMGWFFIVFGGLKVMRLSGFVEAYQKYDLIAMRSRAYAYVYPFLELFFGISYLLAWQVVAVSVVVAVVMVIGALGVYLKLRAKEEIPCACLGTVFKVPMTWVTLGEDLLMAGMAIALILM